MKSTDSVIVSWDFSRGKDVGVLIVGSQKNGRVDVINAYQGKEAYELYRKLTIQKKGADNIGNLDSNRKENCNGRS